MQNMTIVDPVAEARIRAYHAGRESAADPDAISEPIIGVAEVEAELEIDLWNALMQGVA